MLVHHTISYTLLVPMISSAKFSVGKKNETEMQKYTKNTVASNTSKHIPEGLNVISTI